MTAPKRPRRTAQRVLEVALALFNAHGESHVTPTDIADEMAISPGNLYYHYKNKDAIIEPIVAQFAAELDAALTIAQDRAITVEDMWLFLHLVFETIWRYRFLYRDLADLCSRYRAIRNLFREVIARQTEASIEVFDGLRDSGDLKGSKSELRALATNMVMLTTFWLSFEEVIGRGEGADQLGLGVYQVMTAVAPYLQGGARAHFERLSAAYV